MVLCGKLKQVLPGTLTIPEQISQNKQPYYDALEAADKAYKKGRTDVGDMETLMEGYLANQLVDVHNRATGTNNLVAESSETAKKGGIVRTIETHPVIVTCIVTVILAIVGIIFS